MTKDKIITGIAVITTIVITAIVVAWLLSLSAPAPFEEKATGLLIQGPDAIEIGEKVPYRAILDGEVCLVGFPEVTWETKGGQIMSRDGDKIVLMAHQPGTILLEVSFSGMKGSKSVKVYPKSTLITDIDTWIHPENWYSTGIKYSGVSDPVLKLYRILETGRTVEASKESWEFYGCEEILIKDNGNYLLVAESKAFSDNRKIVTEKKISVTPFVQRGYHQFSWDAENLVQLTPADKMAIRFFLEQELGVSPELLPEGKIRDANRIDSDYVFYKDSSRRDTLLYQVGVKSAGTTTRKTWQSSIKGNDGRYVHISWDDFIVSVNMGNPGTSFFSTFRDSGGSSSGSSGSGPSPSPPIGGGPSPSLV